MKRTAILAHRGNIDGAAGTNENTLAHCSRALALGFGLETDLRRAHDGRFYISHDLESVSSVNALETYAPVFKRHPAAVLAVNVKDLMPPGELIRLQAAGEFGTESFYFDFELLEPDAPGQAQRAIRSVPGGANARLAARISDRGETIEQCLSIPAQLVWADEFDSDWLAHEHIEALRAADRQVFAVSPELHGRAGARRRWADFKEWGVDGVCTDFSLEADVFFNQ